MPKRQSQRLLLQAAKRQKLDAHNESTTPADDLSPFEKLPEHVIEKIVNNLKFDGIKDMFLVSKCIYGILSNSPTIMSRFQFKISKVEDLQASNIRGGRKYSKIKFRRRIKGKDLTIMKSFLTPFASNIKHIRLVPFYFAPSNHSITKQMIENVLSVCKNVQTFKAEHLMESNVENENRWKNVQPFDLPELKTLKFPRNGYRLFEMFKNCQLKTFNLSETGRKANSYHVKDFLQSQTELENLKLNFPSDLFNDDKFTKMKFNLKTLVIEESREFEPNDTFTSFVTANAAFLVELNVSRNIFNVFSICRHIKILVIDNFTLVEGRDYADEYNFDFVMDSVEQLTLRHGVVESHSLAYTFPNIKTLKLFVCTIADDMLKDLPNVERLKLSYCKFECAVSLTKLKKLFVLSTETKFHGLEGNKMKDLILSGGKHAWIRNFLELDDTNLEHLELYDFPSKYNFRTYEIQEMHEYVKGKHQKIRQTIIADYCPQSYILPF